MPAEVERKLAAILSADVVGYSRLMAEDEDQTVRRLGAYRREIGALVEEHRGLEAGSEARVIVSRLRDRQPARRGGGREGCGP